MLFGMPWAIEACDAIQRPLRVPRRWGMKKARAAA
jgi:hypothetical protein